ncbi:methylase [Sulfolobus acidocaldarius SUSAZ]|nr:methylase [Sulfolobus acidocaldarius SUSAZ]
MRAIIPLPFKDSVFDNVLISEVMDYDVVREAHRVTKRGGKGMIIVPQNNAVDALKVLSIKFRIISASEVNKYWIIEGVKVR